MYVQCIGMCVYCTYSTYIGLLYRSVCPLVVQTYVVGSKSFRPDIQKPLQI